MTARELAQEMTNDEAAKIIGHAYISGMRAGKTQLEAALYKAIEALQERKTGKWIAATPLPMEADSYKHKRYWKCSVCGGHDFFNPQYSEKVKFCRYCGAELEVDE